MSRAPSIAISIAVYLLVILLIVLSFDYFSEYPLLLRILMADLLGTVLIFISSMLFNNSSMYDPYWSVKPVVIAAFYFLMIPEGGINLYQAVALFLIVMYGLRLTVNFYRGWTGMGHEDWRYRNFRKQFPKLYWLISFFGVHLFPTIMVYLGCLPMFIIFKEDVEFSGLAWLGLFVLASSIVLAYIADKQLWNFRQDPGNAGKGISSGLWSKSRHPNYLGEILSWWGLFLLALSSGLNYWWTGTGALVITLMFVFISIPLIEKYASSRRKDYVDYMRNTSMLLPLPKSKK